VVLGVLEFGLDPRAAVDAPRTHHQWFPDVLLLEGPSWSKPVRAELAAMGHHVRSIDHLGIANSIVVNPATGQIHGIADRRRSTTKASGE
jgi:gamma-glutamyltranspeptidase/glutathione hydrolase